jgi:alpha-amylase
MASVCFYFQVHQPFRLRPFTYFDACDVLDYFDEKSNAEILQKVAEKCYLPANAMMLKLIERYQGRFRIAYSISGVAVEQMQRFAPRVLESFVALARTGCVELIGETYHHSLAALYDEREFTHQVEQHRRLMGDVFGSAPRVFRNTELIYDDGIGSMIAKLGYAGVVAEGCDDVLGQRSPNYIYQHPQAGIPLLLRNYSLSDDIAFRFSNSGWPGYPLTAPKYARWLHERTGAADVINLFMDYETFGEHQWSVTGIFDFIEQLPGEVLNHSAWDFCTPSEALSKYRPAGRLSFARTTSWADEHRDISAWQGNRIQKKALQTILALGERVRQSGSAHAAEVWRKLQISDHFYYMCTKLLADGDVHAYFTPYGTPYDSFIRYMNVVKDFGRTLGQGAPG